MKDIRNVGKKAQSGEVVEEFKRIKIIDFHKNNCKIFPIALTMKCNDRLLCFANFSVLTVTTYSSHKRALFKSLY